MFLKGQEKVKGFLRKAIAGGRFPSSTILIGERGVGRSALALESAMSFLCLGKGDWACGECESCRLMQRTAGAILEGRWEDISVFEERAGRRKLLMLRGDHPDFIYVPPDGGSVSIDQIRAGKEFAYSRPALSKGKAVLIEGADLMTREAGNALLKVLEEPPARTVFIMTSESEESLLETILSRSVLLRMEVPSFELFKEITGIDSMELYRLAKGSPYRAFLLREHEDIIKMADMVFEGKMSEIYQALSGVDSLEGDLKELLIDLLEERLMENTLSGRIDLGTFEDIQRVILDLRTGMKRGIRLAPCLFGLRDIMEGRHGLHKGKEP